MWYQQPAREWMQALPIGNGRLAGMVYGGIYKERVALNEISMWSGKPDETDNELCGRDKLDEMRRAFFAGDDEEANRLGHENLTGKGRSFGTHLPLGDLVMDFNYPEGHVTGYRRSLDLAKATATVSFRIGGTEYRRQYIADYPDDVMAIRCTASKSGSINTTVGLSLLRDAKVVASSQGLTLTGKVCFPMHGPGGVDFCGEVRLVADGGKLTASDGKVMVTGADALTLIIDVRTNLFNKDYVSKCRETAKCAAAQRFDTLLSRHVADYRRLFDRVNIQLGSSADNNLPTDVRLTMAKEGVRDGSFDALFFQYGRYMLISSSRPSGMPLCANLQGVWNDNGACNMPWTCDYHLDINTEQNYWAANRANLPECNAPLFAYVGLLAKHGSKTARKMYGCRGWCAHTVTNPWGFTAPGWGVGWGMNVTGGAWMCTHLWSHYLYTRDTEWLRCEGYPLLKSCAEFFVDYMVADPATGWLVTGPSISPENGYINENGNSLSLALMPTIDRNIVYDIYHACIEASKVLGVDKPLRRQLEKDIKRLPPLQIGSDGQIQEWLHDVRRSDPSHRHSSHLLALFPLNQISYTREPELMAAAKRGLEIQTASENWEDTEWSSANMLCFYSRLKDAETAHGWLQGLFKRFTRENLMTVSPKGVAMAEYDIFSFDATEASVAGMCEMLLQSYDGFLELLPALPRAWSDGHVSGLCAEGGLTVDIDWTDGRVTNVTLHATSDTRFALRAPGLETPVMVALKKGESKTVTFEAQHAKSVEMGKE